MDNELSIKFIVEIPNGIRLIFKKNPFCILASLSEMDLSVISMDIPWAHKIMEQFRYIHSQITEPHIDIIFQWPTSWVHWDGHLFAQANLETRFTFQMLSLKCSVRGGWTKLKKISRSSLACSVQRSNTGQRGIPAECNSSTECGTGRCQFTTARCHCSGTGRETNIRNECYRSLHALLYLMPIGSLFASDQYASMYESAENRFSQMDRTCGYDAAELGGMFHD
jgi:hypothetical protein